LMHNARAWKARLLVMVASSNGDRRAGAAVRLAVMRPRLRVMRPGLMIGPRLDIVSPRLDVMRTGLRIMGPRLLIMRPRLLIMRARLLVVRPRLLIMRPGLLIISRAGIVILGSGLLIMAVLVAIPDDRCARKAANYGANDGAFCPCATARDLATDHGAKTGPDKAANNLIVIIGRLMLVRMLVICIVGLRRYGGERHGTDGRDGSREIFDHGSCSFCNCRGARPLAPFGGSRLNQRLTRSVPP
jgi:hypothetical protein